jgi:hypothetical protein
LHIVLRLMLRVWLLASLCLLLVALRLLVLNPLLLILLRLLRRLTIVRLLLTLLSLGVFRLPLGLASLLFRPILLISARLRFTTVLPIAVVIVLSEDKTGHAKHQGKNRRAADSNSLHHGLPPLPAAACLSQTTGLRVDGVADGISGYK